MSFNKNSGYGQALMHAIYSVTPTFGKVFVVCPAADSNYAKLASIITPDPDGMPCLYTTVKEAYDNAVTSTDTVIALAGATTHTVSAMLTVAKNRVHFIGIDGGGHLTAQGAKIQMGVTGVATDLAPVLVTGVRNSFKNIKFINASTTNESLYGFIDNGEGTVIKNCSMMKVAGLNDANHAHFWMAGDSLSMKDCVVGQSNVPSTAAACGILIDGKTGGATDGTVKENFLENVKVQMSVSGVHATSFFIKIADTAAMNFINVFDKFSGHNFIPVGGTILTDAISAPAGILAGTLHLVDPAFMGATGNIDTGSAGVQISARGLAPVAAGGLATNVA